MPDLVTHYVSSYLVARSALRPRYAAILALVGLLPDVDVLLRVHRWVTHSFILALAVATPLLVLTYRFRRGCFDVAVLSVIIYLLHLVLDLFAGPTPILYPLADSIWIRLVVYGVYSDIGIALTPRITVETMKPDFTPQPAIEGPIVSETGAILAVISVLALLLSYLGKKKQA